MVQHTSTQGESSASQQLALRQRKAHAELYPKITKNAWDTWRKQLLRDCAAAGKSPTADQWKVIEFIKERCVQERSEFDYKSQTQSIWVCLCLGVFLCFLCFLFKKCTTCALYLCFCVLWQKAFVYVFVWLCFCVFCVILQKILNLYFLCLS